MAIELQQILVTLAFFAGFFVLNLNAGHAWLKFITFVMMLASLGWALYLALRWMW